MAQELQPNQPEEGELLLPGCGSDVELGALLLQRETLSQFSEEFCGIILDDIKTTATSWAAKSKGAQHQMSARSESTL